jgi:hypothetical protein
MNDVMQGLRGRQIDQKDVDVLGCEVWITNSLSTIIGRISFGLS